MPTRWGETWGMEPRLSTPPARAGSRFGVSSRIGLLLALGVTTIALATSAIQVVAASIREHAPASSEGRACSGDVEFVERAPQGGDDEEVGPPSSFARPSPGTRPATSPAGSIASSLPVRDRSLAFRPRGSTTILPTTAPVAIGEPGRLMIRDAGGRPVVAAIHGRDGDRVAALLPDGSIGWPDGLVETDRPFATATMAEVERGLLSEFPGFTSLRKAHYVVVFGGSDRFAQASLTTLESLYSNLLGQLAGCGLPVHEAEFPLVAVIFRTEGEFRRHRKVPADVQAYYEVMANRIYFYETSDRDRDAPEVAALRKPQTVAHEGTHQILANIGLHPRLSNWPLWLVEGLAEFCASPVMNRNGSPSWKGIGNVNLLHMATIRDLDDPLSSREIGPVAPALRRVAGQPLAEYLVTRSELSPTDYALAWALTHHLATKRPDEFLAYLKTLSQLPPLARRTPEDHLRDFKAAFGDNLVKLDAAVGTGLRKLKGVDALPHYAVTFEQVLPNGQARRAVMVSQSPLIIREWIETTIQPVGGDPVWWIYPHPTRSRALIAARQWLNGD